MNLKSNHSTEKPVSAIVLFKGEGITTAIQIAQNQQLKEHTTKIPALLVCVSGEIVFENENGIRETLQSGDFIHIEPLIRHWVVANQHAQLLLLK
jgi:quercetin dioxygenase-like cupin family protein